MGGLDEAGESIQQLGEGREFMMRSLRYGEGGRHVAMRLLCHREGVRLAEMLGLLDALALLRRRRASCRLFCNTDALALPHGRGGHRADAVDALVLPHGRRGHLVQHARCPRSASGQKRSSRKTLDALALPHGKGGHHEAQVMGVISSYTC